MSLAGTFIHLLLIRIVVAVGEAGCIPPAHSLIADYFPRAERPRAVARYRLGLSFASVLGFAGVGWLNEFVGWRVLFVLLGLPGLALAGLAWFTLSEPRRRGRSHAASLPLAVVLNGPKVPAISMSAPPSLKEVALTLWENATFRHLLLMQSVASFFGWGMTQWQPTFFVRSFGLQTGEIGIWFALVAGACGMLGIYLGGEVVSRYAKQNERLQLQGAAVLCACLGLVSSLIYLAPNQYMAYGCIGVTTVGFGMTTGPFFAMIQTLVPERMRAVSVALVYLAANLIGMGLGPLAAGGLSDALRPTLGEESLRYALLALCPGYVWAGWHYWRASKTVTRDVQAVQLEGNHLARDNEEGVSQMHRKGAY
jgi:MFS family permease